MAPKKKKNVQFQWRVKESAVADGNGDDGDEAVDVLSFKGTMTSIAGDSRIGSDDDGEDDCASKPRQQFEEKKQRRTRNTSPVNKDLDGSERRTKDRWAEIRERSTSGNIGWCFANFGNRPADEKKNTGARICSQKQPSPDNRHDRLPASDRG